MKIIYVVTMIGHSKK